VTRAMNFRRAAKQFSGLAIAALALDCALLQAQESTPETGDSADGMYRLEISDTRKDIRVDRALTHIVTMREQLNAELIELTEVPAPPFAEGARAAHFARMLREAGLTDVTIDGAGNVIGRRHGNGGDRVVAYTAHLDTVFPAGTDVNVSIDEDTYKAPGIADNTRGLIVVLAVLRALEYAGIETEADILFIGDVGEEGLGDLRGVKHLFRNGGDRIDSMIAVDGGKTERLIFGGVGSHRYRVTYKGPGGHSWGAFGTANPHHALGRAIAAFVEQGPDAVAGQPKVSYNIGRMGGGTSVNSVPFESWMEVDLRSGSQDRLDAIDEVFQAAVQKALAEENAARTRGPELTVDVKRVGTRPAAKGDIESALVQRAAAAMREFEIEPDFAISSTDANYPISLGIPAITMSRGGVSEGSHSLHETWQDKNSHVAIQIGLLALIAEAGLAD